MNTSDGSIGKAVAPLPGTFRAHPARTAACAPDAMAGMCPFGKEAVFKQVCCWLGVQVVILSPLHFRPHVQDFLTACAISARSPG